MISDTLSEGVAEIIPGFFTEPRMITLNVLIFRRTNETEGVLSRENTFSRTISSAFDSVNPPICTAPMAGITIRPSGDTIASI